MTRVDELGTILGVWAHPDDEAYLAAGLWPAERLGRLRATELHASLAALGVTEHQFLGYRDGTCAAQDTEEAVGRITAVVREVRPDTIITFGPDGMTGHDDHRTVSAWAAAVHARVVPDARLLYATTTPAVADRWRAVHAEVPVFYADDLPVRTAATAERTSAASVAAVG